MTVQEMKKLLEMFPEDEEISVLYPDDNYGVDTGVTIAEVAYIAGTKNIRNGVYIKMD